MRNRCFFMAALGLILALHAPGLAEEEKTSSSKGELGFLRVGELYLIHGEAVVLEAKDPGAMGWVKLAPSGPGLRAEYGSTFDFGEGEEVWINLHHVKEISRLGEEGIAEVRMNLRAREILGRVEMVNSVTKYIAKLKNKHGALVTWDDYLTHMNKHSGVSEEERKQLQAEVVWPVSTEVGVRISPSVFKEFQNSVHPTFWGGYAPVENH